MVGHRYEIKIRKQLEPMSLSFDISVSVVPSPSSHLICLAEHKCLQPYTKQLARQKLKLYIHILPITRGSSGRTVQSGQDGPGPDAYKTRTGVLGFSFLCSTTIH
jgi:hypothetical protein